MLVAYFFSKKIVFHHSTSKIQPVVHLIIQPVVYIVNRFHRKVTNGFFSHNAKKRECIVQNALPLKLYRSELSRFFFLFCFCCAFCCCFRRMNSRTERASASSWSRFATSRFHDTLNDVLKRQERNQYILHTLRQLGVHDALVPYSSRLSDLSIDEMNLTVRSSNGLKRANIHTFGTAKLTKSEPNPASARAVSMSSNVMVSAPSLWLQ